MLFSKPITEISDQELIAQYRNTSDIEALGYLYTRYTALVYGVCMKYLKDRDEAKDAVMGIFEKLIGTLQEHEVTHFKSWLYVTARNYCLMHLRANKNKQTEELPPFLMESDGFTHLEEGSELEENLVKLENCIEKLAGEQQQCVRLFYLQQKCYQEIGDATGYDLKKVKSYIQNGKRNLKICMEAND
ncbi:MAG: sigma-70 family RNA polymerase sigma factor [Cyclobacteriaceae bacterium]|nr:sigma-70 family RNA polymerase sigma factor [Cyclobacteriaceae bacterium]